MNTQNTKLEIIPQTDQITGNVYFMVARVNPLNENKLIAFIQKFLGWHIQIGTSFPTREEAEAFLERLYLISEMGSDNFIRA